MISDTIHNTQTAPPLKPERAIVAHESTNYARQRAPLPKGTNALLRTAYRKLQDAEERILEQKQRISDLRDTLTTDELTGLTNRRGFMQIFEKELDRINRSESHKSGLLVMLDLDHFKSINDRYGHLAGDEALKVVASFLRKESRNMDTAARLGGDEFMLLMPDTSIDKALERLRRFENRLNSLSYFWHGAKIDIKGSVGLKEYTKDEVLEDIIHAADLGMYNNKDEKKIES